ncbi:hypothetical protein GS501_00540 [Saccharibacter sp. 17.LH.SD]|nr:hypothetical protein [Saccharibacter sp. 17.LH.SD]
MPSAWGHDTLPPQHTLKRDLTQEEHNRRLVLSFYDRFFNKHDLKAASIVADTYKQHNPDVPNGKKHFIAFFTDFFQKNPQAHTDIIRSATEDDLVYLHVHSKDKPTDLGQAIVDIFRVKNGQIVEHWDVIQDVPAHSQNDNTMF